MTAKTRTTGPPTRDRTGYYATPQGRYMSVTTILSNGVPKPALMHWAAWEAASCAVESIPDLVKARGQAARNDLRGWIQRASERKRDATANLGSTIHGFLEAQILGEPTPQYDDEQRPFIDGFNRFLEDWQPVYEATELTVANPEHGYAGTLDAKLRLPSLGDDLFECDYKSGKSIYPEVGMQLAAYRRATVGWLKDGTEVVPPPTARAVVLHVRPKDMPGGEERGYALHSVKTTDDVFAAFLHAKAIAEATLKDGLFSQILSDPLPVPKTEAVA